MASGRLRLHHSKGVLNFCADVSLCGLDQIIDSPLGRVG